MIVKIENVNWGCNYSNYVTNNAQGVPPGSMQGRRRVLLEEANI